MSVTPLKPQTDTPRFVNCIKPSVRQLQAYTLKHLEAPVKINQNENPFDLPDSIKSAAKRLLTGRSWSRYPPFVASELTAALAQFSGWRSDGILVGNGSNELIEAVLMVVVERGKRVVIPQPTFTLYRLMSSILGGDPIEVRFTENFEFDVPALLREVQNADITVLCSPNNPTGGRLADPALRQILQAASGLVVLDEAYHEFSGKSVIHLLPDFENLIVLRTFSKAMAMAGLRVGYLLGHPGLVREIAKAKLPYNLNFFSLAAAEAAIGNFHLLKPQVDLIVRERGRVFQRLQEIPQVRPLPSQANFIAFATELNPMEVFERLYSRGILVRDISRYPMMEKFLRVSIGTQEENDLFLSALEEVLQVAR
jgi:histidinol-phosphate aminotransferase